MTSDLSLDFRRSFDRGGGEKSFAMVEEYERRMRIRLKFQEPEILTSQQIMQGLAQSWYLVRFADVRTIADLAFDIRAFFHLEKSCPDGLSLQVDGFVLPASQSAHLLKDSDLVRIQRRNNSSVIPDLHVPRDAGNYHREVINGYRLDGYCGHELCTLDECEEGGGNQSKEEERGNSLLCGRENNQVAESGERMKNSRSDESGQDIDAGVEVAVTQDRNAQNAGFDHRKLHNVRVEFHSSDKVKNKDGKHQEEEDENGTAMLRKKRSLEKFQAVTLDSNREQEQVQRKHKKARKMNRKIDRTCMSEPESDGIQKGELKKPNLPEACPVSADLKLINIGKKEKFKLIDVEGGDGRKEGTKRSRQKKKSSDVHAPSIMTKDKPVVREKKLKVVKIADDAGTTKESNDTELEPPVEKPRRGSSKRLAENHKMISPKTPRMNGHGVLTGSENGGVKLTPLDCKVDRGSPLFRTLKTKDKNTEADVEQRPSRSARRKKAKRAWLREQAEIALHKTLATHLSESNGSKVPLGFSKPEGSSISKEVIEMEAEEEVLPIVVRPGHIRFEPYEEDEGSKHYSTSLPMLHFGDQLKSKRQGQNWGQEKSCANGKGNRWTIGIEDAPSSELKDDVRCSTNGQGQTIPVNFETLPYLEGFPQVGVLVCWENAANKVKLDPHPDYPFLNQEETPEDEDFSRLEEDESISPYDENGLLETEFSSLVEVRLVKREVAEHHEVVPALSSEDGEGTEKNQMPKPGLDRMVLSCHRGSDVTPEPATELTHMVTSTVENRDVENRDIGKCETAWQDLVLELEKKKLEICSKDVLPAIVAQETVALHQHVGDLIPGSHTVGSEGGKPINESSVREVRRSKYLRSAGVGSIVALLRAQQVL